MKLYYSPGTVSLATHIALEEAGLSYSLERVSLKEGEHLTAEYRQINPLARVPALVLPSGEVLMETPALLSYVAELAPSLQLLPADPLGRARAHQWFSFFASSVHIAFLHYFRPERFTDDAAGLSALKRDGKLRFFQTLKYVESCLGEKGFMLGPDYSLVDSYASVFYLWARRFELQGGDLPRYTKLAQAVFRRPAVQRVLEQEGLTAALSLVIPGA